MARSLVDRLRDLRAVRATAVNAIAQLWPGRIVGPGGSALASRGMASQTAKTTLFITSVYGVSSPQ